VTLAADQAQKATVTVKISRVVREFIAKSTSLNEPVDRTLRRLLKLRIPVGVFPARSPRETPKNPPSMTTIKITEEVRDHITSKARWNESIDQTLRRLFNLKSDAETVSSRRSR
jgi:ribosomal protein S21